MQPKDVTKSVDTGVQVETLKRIAEKSVQVPSGFVSVSQQILLRKNIFSPPTNKFAIKNISRMGGYFSQQIHYKKKFLAHFE